MNIHKTMATKEAKILEDCRSHRFTMVVSTAKTPLADWSIRVHHRPGDNITSYDIQRQQDFAVGYQTIHSTQNYRAVLTYLSRHHPEVIEEMVRKIDDVF